ncbi:AAA domain-containing protein [Verrucomicrobium sp. GAS474]|nr:AAA domain-containing protein [Verrucomicrobium sp. GAS474]
MPCRSYRISGEGNFFSDLLAAAEHAIPDSGSPAQKRNRLIEFLVDKATSTGEDRLVLFIDDAQRLTEIQFEWLMDIHTDLDKRGVAFIVLLVGQPELAKRKEAYCKTGQMQIVGRFMVHSRRFMGLTSAREVQQCLKEYDTAEFPQGSGCSFSRHYFPRAWNQGWRLADHAQDFWEAIRLEAEGKKIDKVDEVPMAYFTRMVGILLTKYGEKAVSDPEINAARIKDIVRRSNCIEALVAKTLSEGNSK